MTSPLSPSIRAGESGRSRPAASTKAGTERSGISTSEKGLASATGSSSSLKLWRQSHTLVTGRSLGPQDRLRAPEEGDRPAGRLGADRRVPDLRRPSCVHVRGDDGDPALPRGAEVVGLELDR